MSQTVNIPGVGTVQFPDGMSHADMAAAIKQNFPNIHPQTSVADINQAAQQYMANQPASGSAGQRFLAGAGEQFVNVGRGAEQLGAEAGELLGIPGAQALSENVQQKIDAEAPLQRKLNATTAGKVGALTGDVAIAAPTAFVPGVNTAVGASLVGAGLGALQPTEEGQSRLKNVALGAGAGLAGQFGGKLIAKGARAGGDYLSQRLLQEGLVGTRPEAVASARELGYRLTPSQAGGAPIGSMVESVAGVPSLQQGASRLNQRITNDLVRQEFGIPGHQPITEEALNAAKKPAYDVYKEISKLGPIKTDEQYTQDLISAAQPFKEMGEDFPEATSENINKLVKAYAQPEFRAKSAIQAIRSLRRDSVRNMKNYDPEKNALGDAQKRVANALEDQIERYAASRAEGFDKPNLVNEFKAARTQLAKIHSVEQALEPDSGDVSAHSLAKQLAHGVPLSGNLRKIADVATHFPQVTRSVSKTPNYGPYSRIDLLLGSWAALKHDPRLLAIIAARPAIKKALLSDIYQSTLKGGKENTAVLKGIKATAAIPAKVPYLLKSLPGIAAQTASGNQ